MQDLAWTGQDRARILLIVPARPLRHSFRIKLDLADAESGTRAPGGCPRSADRSRSGRGGGVSHGRVARAALTARATRASGPLTGPIDRDNLASGFAYGFAKFWRALRHTRCDA